MAISLAGRVADLRPVGIGLRGWQNDINSGQAWIDLCPAFDPRQHGHAFTDCWCCALAAAVTRAAR